MKVRWGPWLDPGVRYREMAGCTLLGRGIASVAFTLSRMFRGGHLLALAGALVILSCPVAPPSCLLLPSIQDLVSEMYSNLRVL